MPCDPALQTAENLAESFEGFSAAPYQDSGGTWTIGIGSIWDYRCAPVQRVTARTPPITLAVARMFLAREMQDAMRGVADAIRVPLTDNQRAALDDLAFNIGIGAFDASTLLACLRRGDYAGAAAQFDRWDRAGGRELAGLLRRREVETALFQNPGDTFGGAA